MPPAWNPPKLLLAVVSSLHVVVGTSGVVGVVVDGGVWPLGTRKKSNREYSSKVLASKDLHYICIGINEMVVSVD